MFRGRCDHDGDEQPVDEYEVEERTLATIERVLGLDESRPGRLESVYHSITIRKRRMNSEPATEINRTVHAMLAMVPGSSGRAIPEMRASSTAGSTKSPVLL
ncbi:hypothetical protein HFX_1316 [Haloferax mediterranei ATCC 33500]|uniref:Uncharacterized protein n=1 Tax=Haloferax mediterranei (strain ATCC 33500 / DSM 1411 / JCM 8866 / NBRC 14739 / NCIMB 2177 / R-4) TaxID=523841 RepID=I3R466_HALMT|nr:hypothetical protein HFX_1316 [Haloferax mediterranei ATCC 33500]